METIAISPRFFKHELNNYYQWEQAFWRELIQNSIDEKSSRIEIEIHADNESTKIQFNDNGPGMNEKTLRDIYFNLGATGKEGCDTIGGHGRARIITCFAHESYQIRTQDLLCLGSGGSFSIETNHPYIRGCHIQVLTKESPLETLTTHLKDYLKTCQLPCSITINGDPFSDWLYKRKATRTLSFGTIHTTKQRENSVLIRVRGVAMFERNSPCRTGAIIEIEPSCSRNILTASRDNLKYSEQRELDGFLSEIAIDNRSLTRDLTVCKTDIYGKFKQIKTSEAPQSQIETLQNSLGVCLTTQLPPPNSQPCGEFIETTVDLQEPNQPDYSLHYEDVPKKLLQSTKKFEPQQLGGTRLKLLKVWDETCKFLLEHLAEKTQQDLRYLPGFVFGPNIRGLHKTERNSAGNAHILYINPLDERGNINISCQDIHTLFAIGVHEITHVIHSYHNEDYAAELTQLVEETLPKLPELKRRIRNSL